jgi:hypothetical protein
MKILNYMVYKIHQSDKVEQKVKSKKPHLILPNQTPFGHKPLPKPPAASPHPSPLLTATQMHRLLHSPPRWPVSRHAPGLPWSRIG